MKVIFLDIDGVLNGHDWDEGAQSTKIRYSCIKALNRILAATNARIVVSSAWRYMLLGGHLTNRGFEYLLRTHGAVGVVGAILGTTVSDEEIPERSGQIAAWLAGREDVESFVILDDDPDANEVSPAMGLQTSPLVGKLVLTDGKCGLTESDAIKAIAILNNHPVVG